MLHKKYELQKSFMSTTLKLVVLFIHFRSNQYKSINLNTNI